MLTKRGGMGVVGGRLKREGVYVYLCLIHIAVLKKAIQYCKAIILQLKKNFEGEKKEKKILPLQQLEGIMLSKTKTNTI